MSKTEIKESITEKYFININDLKMKKQEKFNNVLKRHFHTNLRNKKRKNLNEEYYLDIFKTFTNNKKYICF